MSHRLNSDEGFLNSLDEIIAINFDKENFGVSELAQAMGMSRSNLHRKIKAITNITSNQYLSSYRLKKGMELLKNSTDTVSEIAYKTGFGSPSYFIKCFRDFYGYPPGEVGNHDHSDDEKTAVQKFEHNRKKIRIITISAAILLGVFIILNLWQTRNRHKSLAEVLNEKVAVAVFNNFTGDENLEAFGMMASEWITSGLRELSVQTSSPEMMRKYKESVGILPGDPTNEVSLYELTGAKYVVTGSFYTKGDEIEVISRLESSQSGNVIYEFPVLSGSLDQKEQLIQEVRDRVKGYWAVKNAEDLSNFNPPKYEAYQTLMECDGSLVDYYCHLRAIDLDSTFMMARVYIYYSSLLWDMDSVHSATGNYIRKHWDQCTDFEKNYYNYTESVKKFRYEDAAMELDKNLVLDKLDLTTIHQSAHFWLGVNRPDMAVLRYQPLFDNYNVFSTRLTKSMYRNYFDALNRLGRHKVVIELNSRFREEDYMRMGRAGRGQLLRSFLMEGKMEDVEKLIETFTENKVMDDLWFAKIYNEVNPRDTVNPFGPGLRKNLNRYTDPENSEGYITNTPFRFWNRRSRANALYILKDYATATEILEELKNVDWDTYITDEALKKSSWYLETWVEGLLGACYARLGMPDKARVQLEILGSMNSGNPKTSNRMLRGIVPYYQARIYAILGEKEKSVQALKKSKNEGRMCEHENFIQDWDLASLMDYQPYRDLVGL